MDDVGEARLARQLGFLLETDALKQVERSCLIADGSRGETSAEHSWQLALMAIVLAEHAPEPLDLGRVLALVAVHDVVEVDAGDTVIYDAAAVATQADREETAASRLFGLLPDDQRARLTSLRDEFEAGTTPEARFARALDAFQPAWLHWGQHAAPPPSPLSAADVLARKRPAVERIPALWAELRRVVASASRRGLLRA